MKTFILAIFGLLALANAQFPARAWDLQEEDVLFSEPHRVHRVHRVHPVVTKAYADPGYEQPAKYVQFKLNYSDISCLE